MKNLRTLLFAVLLTAGGVTSLFASLCGSTSATTQGYTVYGDPIGCFLGAWHCFGGSTTVPTTVTLTGNPGTLTSDGTEMLKGETCDAEHCTLFGCGGGGCRETEHQSTKTKAC